jgi:hypothetical protein
VILSSALSSWIFLAMERIDQALNEDRPDGGMNLKGCDGQSQFVYA